MKVNPTEASQIAGVTRKTLYADMQKGTLSYELTDKKKRLIHVSELERVYGKLAKDVNLESKKTEGDLFSAANVTGQGGAADAEIMKVRLEFLEKEREREREQLTERIEHLTTMLNTEQEERRKITALLTDQSSEKETQVQKQQAADNELVTLKKTVHALRKQNQSILKTLTAEKEKGFWAKLFG